MEIPKLDNLKETAKEMQQHMQNAQKAIVAIKTVGRAGNGLVKIAINGAHYAEKTEISSTLLPTLATEEKEMIEDLVTAAINDATRKVEEGVKQKMFDMTKDFKMPAELEKMIKGGKGSDD